MKRNVDLPGAVRRAMVAHARRECPLECCGLLVGRHGDVIAAVPLANVAANPETRFRIDDREHIALRRTLRRFAPPLDILGVYHSHPEGPPVPSPRDIREAYYPEWIYVVVGLSGSRAQVRGFSLSRNGMLPVRLSRKS